MWFGEVRLIDNVVLEPDPRLSTAGPPSRLAVARSLRPRTCAVDRPRWPRDTDADVAIVGGGLTGLWTACYLAERRPELADRRARGRRRRLRRQRAQRRVVLGAAADEPRLDRHRARARRRPTAPRWRWTPPSTRSAASSPPRASTATSPRAARCASPAAPVQADAPARRGRRAPRLRLRRRRRALARRRRGPRRASAPPTRSRCGVHPAVRRAATRPSWCAGWRTSVERRGVVIHEHTPVEHIERGRVRAGGHRVQTRVRRAGHRGVHRRPPRSAPRARADLLADDRHRTAAGRRPRRDRAGRAGDVQRRPPPGHLRPAHRRRTHRLRRSRRAVPLRQPDAPGVRVRRRGVHERLRATLVELFPALDDVAITHRWGGALAAARDWWCSVGLDRGNGIAWAGGYVGDGVATTNLAGRTLAELITGEPQHAVRAAVGRPPQPPLGARAAALAGDQRDGPPDRPGRSLRGRAPASADRWRGALVDRVTSR